MTFCIRGVSAAAAATYTAGLWRSSSSLLAKSSSFVVPTRSHTGYIPFEGKLPNTDSPERRFYNQCKLVNLQPCKKVTYTFDPFLKSAETVRKVMFVLSGEKVRATNPKCLFKVDVIDNRADPVIQVDLGGDNEGKKVVFEAAFLNAHEVLSEFNRLLLPLVKVEETVVMQSKGEKMRKK